MHPPIRTLIIEDDPMIASSLEQMAALAGHDCDVVHTGENGLARLRDHAFDLVLSDIQLPGIHGHEVMIQAREFAPETPFILVTAHGDVKHAVAAIQAGAFQYLLKPIDVDELHVVMDRALEATRLRRQVQEMRREWLDQGPLHRRLIGRSPAMRAVQDLIHRVARTDSTVLITGETGTGKEVVAQSVHAVSPRASGPLVAFNCAAFNENLMESELFGHERGAFTGATSMRRGRFEDAHGGTIFLDEIGETSLGFQAKLLRVLQERQVERVGGNRPVDVDVRVIASTNRDLAAEVREGRFREDLFYRLRVVPVHLPPLRDRPEDILVLAQHFFEQYREQYESAATGISEAALLYLSRHPWPGNVRELRHTVERAVVLSTHHALEPEDFQFPETGTAADAPESLRLQDAVDRATREHLLHVLDRTGWRKQEAADLLGIDRATLYRSLKKLAIEDRSTGGAS